MKIVVMNIVKQPNQYRGIHDDNRGSNAAMQNLCNHHDVHGINIHLYVHVHVYVHVPVYVYVYAEVDVDVDVVFYVSMFLCFYVLR